MPSGAAGCVACPPVHRSRGRPRRITACLLVAAAFAVTATGCSDDRGSTAAPDADLTAPGAAAEAATPATTTSVVITGEPLNRYTLALGDCFNTYVVGTDAITTKVGCEVPHRHEVFATHVHPAPFGDPWPGDEALQQYAVRLCYAQFAAFAGVIYELSRLTIGAVTPPRANWEDPKARYRGIQCHVSGPSDELLVGSMRGTAR
jgi:hypothetical protein